MPETRTRTHSEPWTTHVPSEQPGPEPGRRKLPAEPSRLAWLGVAAAIIAATWLIVATLAEAPTAQPTRADRAATARLQGLADAYEAARAARANAAATARLQGLADAYEAARAARANAAATARLQGLADAYGATRTTAADAAHDAHLQRLGDAYRTGPDASEPRGSSPSSAP